MKESKHLEKFKQLAGQCGDAFKLTSDFILVEKIPDEELKTAGGIIIPVEAPRRQLDTLKEGRPHWARVLLKGAGYYSQETDPDTGAITEKDIPLDVEVGDIVLLPQASIKYFSLFGELQGYEPDTIGLAQAGEIQLRFHGEDGYRRAFACLNQTPEAQVGGAA